MKLTVPTEKNISNIIPPNYSTWQQIELSYQCAKYAIDNNIEGVFVECGVAAGNNLAAMCKAGRHGYGFDSFEGIPWAGPEDTQQPGIGVVDQSKLGVMESSGITVHTIENVMADFKKYELTNYTLIKGWFENTVKNFTQPISVLRLDGDLYSSTKECLWYLYPLLQKGGILIVDDYQLEGCRKAFDIHFLHRQMPELILDNGITYWEK